MLQQGGELTDAFAQLAPTLEVDWLAALGVNRHDVPAVIASAFRAFIERRSGLQHDGGQGLSTVLAERKVAVLSWVHELSTFIELPGKDAIERIKPASPRSWCLPRPSEASESRYGVDPERIRTVYNGQDARSPRPLGPKPCAAFDELGLPPDAPIVLGCGSVDLRKGADLFVNVARRVLLEPLAASFSPKS